MISWIKNTYSIVRTMFDKKCEDFEKARRKEIEGELYSAIQNIFSTIDRPGRSEEAGVQYSVKGIPFYGVTLELNRPIKIGYKEGIVHIGEMMYIPMEHGLLKNARIKPYFEGHGYIQSLTQDMFIR